MDWLSEYLSLSVLEGVIIGSVGSIFISVIANLISPSIAQYTKIPFIRFRSKRVAWKRGYLKYISQLSTNRNASQLLAVKTQACLSQALISLLVMFSLVLLCNQWLVGMKVKPEDPIVLTPNFIPAGMIIACCALLAYMRLTQASNLFRMLEQSVFWEYQRKQEVEGYCTCEELDTITDDQVSKLYILLNGGFWKRIFRRDGLAIL